MFFMIGVTEGRKDLAFNQMIICRICGRYGRYTVCMTFTQLLLFFIPVFRWNKQYIVTSTCCGSTYRLDPAIGQRIARGENVEIQERDLTPMYSGSCERHCQNCGFTTTENFEFCPHCGKKF